MTPRPVLLANTPRAKASPENADGARMQRLQRLDRPSSGARPATYPFPRRARSARLARVHEPAPRPDVLETIGTVSRQMRDLARSLDCLGYFDDDEGRPKAA